MTEHDRERPGAHRKTNHDQSLIRRIIRRFRTYVRLGRYINGHGDG